MEYIYFMAPILTFAMTAAITPGPNNIILSTNAVNYGFKETIPLILGVFFGFLSVLSLCLLGIGEVYESFPNFKIIHKNSRNNLLNLPCL